MAANAAIYGKVTKVLVEALNVDEDEVTPEASLQGDLGAESIDFLDIVFRLEREFGIKIAQGELFAGPVLLGDAEMVHDGQLTDQGLAALRARMPYADLGALERDRRLTGINDLFTVELLSRFVEWKVGKHGAARGDDTAPARLHTAAP